MMNLPTKKSPATAFFPREVCPCPFHQPHNTEPLSVSHRARGCSVRWTASPPPPPRHRLRLCVSASAKPPKLLTVAPLDAPRTAETLRCVRLGTYRRRIDKRLICRAVPSREKEVRVREEKRDYYVCIRVERKRELHVPKVTAFLLLHFADSCEKSHCWSRRFATRARIDHERLLSRIITVHQKLPGKRSARARCHKHSGRELDNQ